MHKLTSHFCQEMDFFPNKKLFQFDLIFGALQVRMSRFSFLYISFEKKIHESNQGPLFKEEKQFREINCRRIVLNSHLTVQPLKTFPELLPGKQNRAGTTN